MEAVVVGGDLMRLSPAQRLEWYAGRCKAAGLDPRTQPFQYISLSGKLTLYATKAATDQLIAVHRLGVAIVDRRMLDGGIYEVVVRVTFPDGRIVEDVGAVSVPPGAKGEILSNAIMKAVTKAKRRTVLSACGLGMLDDSEVESAGARVVAVDHRGELLDRPEPVGDRGPLLPPPAVAVAAVDERLSDDELVKRDDHLERMMEEAMAGDLEDVANAFLADEIVWDGKPWIRQGQTWRNLTPARMRKILASADAFFDKVQDYKGGLTNA
jgi:hypothetical protein